MMATAAAAALTKASEDHLSEASESTASGSGSPPSEPPMSPEMLKLTRGLLKPQELSLTGSANTMSPIGLNFETESVPSPQSRGSLTSFDSETRTCGGPVLNSVELAAAEAIEQMNGNTTPKAVPPAPKYSAPSVAAPSLPPPPSLPPGVPEPPSAPPQLPSAAAAAPTFTPQWPKTVPPSGLPSLGPTTAPVPKSPAFGYSPPAMLPSGLPAGPACLGPVPALSLGPPAGLTGPGAMPALSLGAALPDASQRAQLLRTAVPLSEVPPPAHAPLLQQLLSSRVEGGAPPSSSLPAVALGKAVAAALGHGPAAAAAPPLPGTAPLALEETEGDDAQALALLNFLWTRPSVPPLPPSGCYGGVLVSSAISDGLGVAAAEAAEAAARELGERPVKVLLPWYPAHPGVAMFDQTKPAKVPTFPEHDSSSPVPVTAIPH